MGAADIAQVFVSAVQKHTKQQIVAVASRTPGKAEAFAEKFGIQSHNNYEDLLARDDIDVIYIPTLPTQHRHHALMAIAAGKHVLIEKPMASSSAECEELIELADQRGLTLMVGHTFIYSESVLKIAQIVNSGDIGEIRYINSQRLNLGLFQKDINVAWDLAPHDLSIILHILGESPTTVPCQGTAHITPGIEDVTNISLSFGPRRFATIQSSWLEPRKVRQMTIVGTKRMIVYDDLQPTEKIRVYDVRVDRPPHYDTFGEFQYSYHYGDSYIPHLQHSEPLKVQCQHFLDCINKGTRPMTCGRRGLELVRILEASSASLKAKGAPIAFSQRTDSGEARLEGKRASSAPAHA
mgnify:CR=1 FL=1